MTLFSLLLLKVLTNEGTLLRTHCCSCFLSAQTRGTQNECCVSMLRKQGNICCGHKMFLNKIRNIFCVRNKCYARGRTGKHLCRQQCVLVCQGLNPPSSLLAAILVTNPVQQAAIVQRLESAILTNKSRSNRKVLMKRLELLHPVDLFDG